MKKTFFTLLACSLMLQAVAQDGEKRPITAAEYEAAKKITVKNLEKDTYVKAGAFILDRSGDPFVFKFSDGTERRVYLYKLFETEKMAELGMYVIYTTPKDGKLRAFPMPGPDAPGEVWGKYIDDLKYGEEAMKGLSSCIAFALTKSGAGGAPVSAKEGEKIEYCFPGEAMVTLTDGTLKAISTIEKGEKVLSINAVTKAAETAIVLGTDVHTGRAYSLTQLTLIDPAARVIASEGTHWATTRLEATANHPVLTARGAVRMEEVRVGDTLYVTENGVPKAFDVFLTQSHSRSTDAVYNLVTDKATYVVNGTVVMTK